MDSCVNCCYSVSQLKNDIDENHPQYVLTELEGPIEISKALSSIYKLNYLNTFLELPLPPSPQQEQQQDREQKHVSEKRIDWESDLNVKLCDTCLNCLTDLYKLYVEFNQLRNLESCLAKDIQRLDNYIYSQQVVHNIKHEPHSEVQQQEQQQVDCIIRINNEENYTQKDGLDNNNIPFTSCNVTNGPWVVVQRLEDDPVAQASVANKTRRARKTVEKYREEEHSDSKFEDCKDIVENEDLISMNNDSPVVGKEEADSDFCVDEEDGNESLQDMASDSDREWTFKKTVSRKSTRIRARKPKRKAKAESDMDNEEDADNAVNSDSSLQPKNKPKKAKTTKSAAASDEGETSTKKKRNKQSKYSETEKKMRSKESEKERRARKRTDKNYRRRKCQTPNPCWHCELDFPTQEDCLKHTMETHFEPGDSICQRCSKITKTKLSQGFHEKQCESLKPGELLPMFKCEHCPKEFPIFYYLKSHVASVHLDEGCLSCSFENCTFQTRNPFSLKQHTRNQHRAKEEPIENRTCKECGKFYATKASLASHFVKYHTEEGSKKYRIQQRALLDRQKEKRRVKWANKKNICQDCNVDFITNLALVLHRKEVHKTNFALVCDQCGKGFSRRATLRYHIEYSHSTERNFYCEACGKNFKTATNLKDHYKRTHDEQGRLEYNAKMKLHNQRRKMRGQALSSVISSASTMNEEQNLIANNNVNSNGSNSSNMNDQVITIPTNLEFTSNFHVTFP